MSVGRRVSVNYVGVAKELKEKEKLQYEVEVEVEDHCINLLFKMEEKWEAAMVDGPWLTVD